MNTFLAIVLVPGADLGSVLDHTEMASLNLSALGEAFKRPGGILQPGLASHSGSGHLGRCPNLPLEVWTELGFSACFVSPES